MKETNGQQSQHFWADRRKSDRDRAWEFIEHLIDMTQKDINELEDEDMSPAADEEINRLRRQLVELTIVSSTIVSLLL
jgi:hypothetical protein